MKPGTPVIGGAAAVALICFFMPWVTVSCNKQPIATLTGWQIAVGWTPAVAAGQSARPQAQGGDTVLLLVLFAAIACLVVAGLCFARIIAPRMGGIIAAAVAVLALILIMNKSMGNQASQTQQGISMAIEWQWGYFLTVLAYLGVLAGGVLNVILPDRAGGPAFAKMPPPCYVPAGAPPPGFIPPAPPLPPGGFQPPAAPPMGPPPGGYGSQFVPPPPPSYSGPPRQAAAGPPVQRATFCTNCGKPLAPGARFCTSCGAPAA
jgi:hypothetical protein